MPQGVEVRVLSRTQQGVYKCTPLFYFSIVVACQHARLVVHCKETHLPIHRRTCMSDAPDQALSQAFQLVEEGKHEEAIAILQPLLDRDPDNADAWWIYSYAVSDPQKARNALNQVLRIAPNYPGARDMLAQLDEKFPVFGTATPRITRLEKPDVPPEPPEPIIERPRRDPAATAETPAARPATTTAPSRRSPLPLILVAVAAVVIIGALLFLLNQPGAPTGSPTETAVVALPTSVSGVEITEEAANNLEATSVAEETPKPEDTEPLAESTLETTETAAESTVEANLPLEATADSTEATAESTVEANIPLEATADSTETTAESTVEANLPLEVTADSAPEATGEAGAYPGLETALAAFTAAEDGIVEAETTFGAGVLASVCTAPGREMRALAPAVMTALARQAPTLPPDVEAIGVRLVNCETNAPLLTLAVDRETANAFAQRTLGAAQFQAAWQPQQ